MSVHRLLLLAGACALAFACASAPETPKVSSGLAAELEGAPDWVRGCANYFDGDKKVVCGVGSVAGTRNPSLAMSAAEGRGRTAIARSLETKVGAMLKDYQSTTTGGEDFGTAANDEQHIEDVAKQITNITLRGTERRETWISPNGTVYALMVMDVDSFMNAVKGMGQLKETIRQAVVERAEKAFGELDAELEKAGGGQ